MKKLTYEFVKKSFESCQYTLVSKEYINSSTKLKYVCPSGHKHSITWDNWSSGCRCPICNGGVKLAYSVVRVAIENEGYTLLSHSYKNNNTKLKIECPNKHRYEVRYGNWVTGHRCPHCAGNARLTFEYVKKSFEKEGYTLLSSSYSNTDSRLDYICSKGHKCFTTWRNWGYGKRCRVCGYEGLSLLFSGTGHPNWKGGKSFETYCAVWKDKEYKQDIRDRDGNRCLNPYCDSHNKYDLTIHHIDYDKHNCHFNNLITVCRSCNSKANYNRKWHKSWYQALLFNRYGYSYLKGDKND